jgi:uncharacterized protein YecE (DUF72 family)
VGCSGWQYDSWRGTVYPRGLPVQQWLEHYAERFNTVEVNSSFYRLPDARTFAAWRSGTPPNFLFSVKASRYLTHLKRLRDPVPPLRRFFGRAIRLGPRLGPVLYQLPSTLSFEPDRLRTFLDALPHTTRDAAASPTARPARGRRIDHVIEFRHPSWYRDDVRRWTRERNVAVCLHDMSGSAFVDPGDQPIVYVRFHGTAGKYRGGYGSRRLERWADRLCACARNGQRVFAYFNNDLGGTAVRDAQTLIDAIETGRSTAVARGAA